MRFLLFAIFASAAHAELSFNRDVRPILSENCFQCHGFDRNTREGDLRLDIPPNAEALKDVIDRITHPDPEEHMPPADSAKSLSDAQIATLKQWIKEGAKYEKHWAYIPPTRPKPPAGKNAIDSFVQARLNAEGLVPSPPADRVTLARRLAFDLIGMPLPPERVDAFVADGNYSALLDELLSSPHFGERMAVYWLDLVRWADTMGFHSDDERFSTPYRDYVIDAFNANMPYDQFAREQLAGDLMPNATIAQQVASGYNRMNQVTGEGGAQPKEYRAKYMADKTRTTASVWLGSTLACAECHDHKFDPFTIDDFYSFAAFFADLEEPDLVSKGRRSAIFSPTIEVPQKDGSKTHTVVSKARSKPRIMRVLARGNWMDKSGAIAEPQVPKFLGSLAVEGRASRLDLANWIAATDNPLTARVWVNRLWYLLFGNGLSVVLDDLGFQGEWPSHPKLLDWLAVEFVESGWDSKHIIRLIAESATYQQSSEAGDLAQIDAKNRLLARQGRPRIAAEFVRDTALRVSGLLTPKIGGRSVKPYQPAGYWADSYKSVGNPHKYKQDHGPQLYRRGVYTFWKRTFAPPAMLTFDAPSREECVARRPSSNTPLQALVLLNDPTFVEAARALAQRSLQAADSDGERLTWAVRQVLSRAPDAAESAILATLLAQNRTRYKADAEAAAALLKVGEEPVPDGLEAAELAAWTAVSRALLNLHETITRF
jgi:cytochrome c553